MSSFRTVRTQIETLDVDEGARGHALHLLTALAGKTPPPAEAVRGYWPTVRLFWGEGEVEVEVHKTGFELYDLHAGNFGISEFPPSGLEPLVDGIQKLLNQGAPRTK